MRDSEMRFEVLRGSENPDRVIWRPYYYRNDYVRCEQAAIWLNENGHVMTDAETLKNQVEFASTWDLILREQGLCTKI